MTGRIIFKIRQVIFLLCSEASNETSLNNGPQGPKSLVLLRFHCLFALSFHFTRYTAVMNTSLLFFTHTSLSNGLSIYCFFQLCERQSNYIPLREIFFLWPLDVKCHHHPQSLPEPSSPSLLFIYVYMKYTILYMKCIILFIHFDVCLHSLKCINSGKSRFLPVFLTLLFPLLKTLPDT